MLSVTWLQGYLLVRNVGITFVCLREPHGVPLTRSACNHLFPGLSFASTNKQINGAQRDRISHARYHRRKRVYRRNVLFNYKLNFVFCKQQMTCTETCVRSMVGLGNQNIWRTKVDEAENTCTTVARLFGAGFYVTLN